MLVKINLVLAHFEAARRLINQDRKAKNNGKQHKLNKSGNIALMKLLTNANGVAAFTQNYSDVMYAVRTLRWEQDIKAFPGYDQKKVDATVASFLGKGTVSIDRPKRQKATTTTVTVPEAKADGRVKFDLSDDQKAARQFIVDNIATKGAKYHRACAAAGVPTRHTVETPEGLVYKFDLPSDDNKTVTTVGATLDLDGMDNAALIALVKELVSA